MLRHLYAYVPPGPPPEVPEVEPPDPNAARALSDAFRAARRSLVALCAICMAWSTAQFNIEEMNFDAVGVTIDLKNASIPLILGASLVYLTVRWAIEFAMLPRHVRRWPLAQLDFRIVSAVARFALLAVAAGALDRSLRSALVVALLLGVLVAASVILSLIFTFLVMPIRMWARERAGRISVASAVVESTFWAGLFAMVLCAVGVVAFGVASYRYDPLRIALWPHPPNSVVLAIFFATLLASYLSPWLLRPLISSLFAERPGYYTERGEDGGLQVHFRNEEREPLL